MIYCLDDAKNRLAYTEKEFEQLKQDYYNLNLKQKELLTTCSTLENQNRNLLSSIEQIEQEKLQLKQNFDNEKEKLLNELQKQDLLSTHNTIDRNQIHLNEDIETLKSRIDDYENAITQYDEYRAKLETNLQKLTQQRDTYKTELKSTREMLINKENEYNQLKIRFDEYEKQLQNNNEYDSQAQELNQNRLTIIQVG
jgi:chromosome segregation ATPase